MQAYADQLNQLSDTMRQVLNDAYVPFGRRIEATAKTAARTAENVAA